MFSSRTLFAGIAAAASLAVLSGAPTSASMPAQAVCDGGTAAGPWRMPIRSQGTGIASGRLVDSVTHQTAYRLRLLLTDEPTPCLSCVQGDIAGTLDDGVGSSPDYFVRGSYFGSFMGGSGSFQLRVFRPSDGAVVGVVTGDFADLPGDGTSGRFLGDWRICP